jgi:putative sporulation protein YyaC
MQRNTSKKRVVVMKYQAHYTDENVRRTLAKELRQKIQGRDLTLLCIGTDRATGDSLGPLIGTKLASRLDVRILGTLDDPVHAANLEDVIEDVIANMGEDDDNRVILAVDAALDKSARIGMITLSDGPLHPGSAVGKTLREVGDLHIRGVVNVGGVMEYFVLQNTRLSLVMHMAAVIAEAIELAVVGERAYAQVAAVE